jgi:predicted aminopeptidase
VEKQSRGYFRRIDLLLSTLGACVLLSACSTTEYLWQAGRGQFSLMNRARPLSEVIRDERTSPRIRALLEEVPGVKAFGERVGMKATANYRDYVHLDREAVVTVVSACESLRFEPKQWSFPIVGGFPYLGFYDEKDAHRYAQTLRSKGFDVDVRGAPAYSTLGWFKDPILSTMIPSGEGALAELVEVILHESLHATAYVNHQAFFNESIASFVAEKLTPVYLRESRPGEEGERLARDYLSLLRRQEERVKRLHDAYQELDRIYGSALEDSEKLAKKESVLSRLREDLRWRSDRDLNNATLVGYKEYTGNREVHEALFKKCGGEWKPFFAGLRALKESDFEERQAKDLSGLVAKFNCG